MMLWKEFEGKDCDECPLMQADICTVGHPCYGLGPMDPPCVCFDDDTDLDEWVQSHLEYERRLEEREQMQIVAAKKKKERAKKAADTRRAMQAYCLDEIAEVKRIQKTLDAEKARERFASRYAEAINATNEMFRYAERVQVNPAISAVLERLERDLGAAKEKYAAKRKEFHARRNNE